MSGDNVIQFPGHAFGIRPNVEKLKPRLDDMDAENPELVEAVALGAGILKAAWGSGMGDTPADRRAKAESFANALYMCWYASARLLNLPPEWRGEISADPCGDGSSTAA